MKHRFWLAANRRVYPYMMTEKQAVKIALRRKVVFFSRGGQGALPLSPHKRNRHGRGSALRLCARTTRNRFRLSPPLPGLADGQRCSSLLQPQTQQKETEMNDMSMNTESTVVAPRGATTAVPIAIPLARLVASAANVRKTGAKEGIAELAASIAAHGLRQNLNVRPAPEGDRFEVVAGGRRLWALRLLAKQKKLPKDVTIPCIIITADEDASEISLVENTLRTSMHPDD